MNKNLQRAGLETIQNQRLETDLGLDSKNQPKKKSSVSEESQIAFPVEKHQQESVEDKLINVLLKLDPKTLKLF